MNAPIPELSEPQAPLRAPSRVREALFGLLPLLLGAQLLMGVVYIPIALRGDADFGAFYVGGLMMRSGLAHHLYDYDLEKRYQNELVSKLSAPYIHLPYEALLFAPLSVLRYRSAYLVYFALNCLLASAAFLLIRGAYGWRDWFPFLLFISYMPLSIAIADGQDSIILLAIAAASQWFLSRPAGEERAGNNDTLAGAILALGLFRFQLVIPIAALFLLWRRWRFVLGFAASSVPLLAGSTWLVGTSQMRLYLTHLLSMSVAPTEAGYAQPVASMVTLRALVATLLPQSHAAAQLATLVASLALLLWTAWEARELSGKTQFALAVAVSVLVSYHLFVYDLSLLMIPMMAIALAAGQQGVKSKHGSIALFIPLLSVPVCLIAQQLHLMALPLFVFLVLAMSAFRDELTAALPSRSLSGRLPWVGTK